MPLFSGLKKDKDPKRPSEADRASRIQRLGPQPGVNTKVSTVDQNSPSQSNNLPQQKVARDLWSEAFASLTQEDRQVLQPAGRDGKPGDVVSQQAAVEKVMDLTKVKYEEYCRRGWHTSKGDTTKATNIRIKAEEIFVSALHFKSIVDAGLKFDPSGYGTIVWGVLSGVMTLVQNHKEKVDAVFDSTAAIARFLPKYAIIEDHYRDRPTQAQGDFEDQIEQVYIAILKYTVCVQKEHDRSVAGQLLDSFWTLENQDIKKLKIELERRDQIVTDQSQLVAHQYRKREFQELHGKALEALSQIEISVEKLLKAERLSTLKWLSDTPLTDKQQQLRSQVERANKDSGKWLLELDRYTDWLTESRSFIWLHGASGCGKSSLCSTVVKNLSESAEQDDNNNMIVAYWYFDSSDPLTQSLQRLLRFILRRISAKATPFPEAIRDLANKHELPDSSPSTTDLIKALTKTVDALEEDIFLVLDAIDEYQVSNETHREEFLDFLFKLRETQGRNLRILVTSIPDPDIDNMFKRLQKPPVEIDIEKPVSVDVDAYLDTTIKKYAEEKHWSLGITDKIHKALKADRRFRMVSLQLEDLRTCYDEDEIDSALKSIPRDVEHTYIQKLQSVAPKNIRRLSHIFYWISVAMRQLTALELVAAPGVNLASPEELLDICPSGMIRLEEQKPSDVDKLDLLQQEAHKSSGSGMQIVTFDHPSVKRFLYSSKLQQSNDGRISPFFVSEKTVNSKFVSLMLDYLLAIKEPSLEPSIFIRNPFLPYAAQHWHEHLKDDENILCEDEALKGKLLMLFGEPMNLAYLNWIRVWNPETQKAYFGLASDSCPSPLYMAVFLNLEDTSKHLISNRSYINGTGGLNHTILQLASQRGYTKIIQDLIAAGEDVDKTTDNQPTALFNAVQSGDAELVEILLAAGANPDPKQPLSDPVLQLASFHGYIKIVKSLVASGADVNLQGGRFGTALQAAAAAGHSEIVAILLSKGAEPDTAGGLLGTAIQAAATGGHSEVVKMLAARGVPWDEGRDSIWHEAYNLWISRSPQSKNTIAQFFVLKELPVESEIQRMLGGVLKAFSSVPAASDDKVIETGGKKPAAPKRETLRTKNPNLVEQFRRHGQEGMEREHYVYRALFWAMLFRCTTFGLGSGLNASKKEQSFLSVVEETLHRISFTITLRAPDQKAIEHGTSDAMLAMRDDLVECYALAFEAVNELDRLFSRNVLKWSFFVGSARSMISEVHGKFEQQNERFESGLKVARLQEPSTEATLLGQMQQEMRGCFQTLEDGVQKRLDEVEHRVVASIRDLLPGIIREEMRKLFAEQKGLAGVDDRD